MSDARGFLSSATFGRFLGTFLPLFGIQFAFGLSGIIYSTFLSRTKDNDSIALLGTVELIQSAVCRPFIFTIAEISGVLISRHHGAKEPHLVARAHFQAYALLICAMSLYSLMTLWAEPIFLFINTEPQMARQAAAYLRTYLPTLWLEAFNNSTFAYLVCQKVVRPFYAYNLVVLSIVGFGSHYFIVSRGLRILGVAYTLTILELTNFLFYNTVRFLACERATYRFPGFQELFRGMGAFTVKVGQSLWIALADTWAFFYNLFLMNRSQVKVDIAAYTSIMTLGAFFFFTCLGIGGTIRTNVGRVIGEGLRASAKREAQGYVLIALLFVAIMSAGLLVFARQMACWYSPSEEMQARLTFGIRTYGCFLVGYVLLNPIFTIYRLVDLDRVIVVTSGIVFPTLVVSATSFMVLYLKWGVYGVFLGYGSFQTLAVCVLAGYIFGVHQWGPDAVEPRVIPELPPSPEPVSMIEDRLIE